MSVQRRKYDPDFKHNAVRLSEDPNRSVKEVEFPGDGREALTDHEKKDQGWSSTISATD
jgi:hypothetical protein